ncbi:putative histone-binding protein rba-1 [Cucumispora dikerogammari]|nr:putative histone-binding protein rba-1 [Cucumispora dikerogammari]
MSEYEQAIVTLKNTKYHHLLYYEFSPSTTSLYFPYATLPSISQLLPKQTLVTSNDTKLTLSTISLPPLFVEKDYLIDEDINIDINSLLFDSGMIYKTNSHWNHKAKNNSKQKPLKSNKSKDKITEYLTFNAGGPILKTAICSSSMNLIACRADNIYIFDYTKHRSVPEGVSMVSDKNNLSENNGIKTIITKKPGFGLAITQTHLISTGLDKKIILYDLYKDTETRHKTTRENSDLSVHGSNICFFVGDDKNLSSFDLRSKDICLYPIGGNGESVDVWERGDVVAVGMKGKSCLYDVRKLSESFCRIDYNTYVNTSDTFTKKSITELPLGIVKFSPHTNFLITAFTDGTVVIYDWIEKRTKYINDFQQSVHSVEWNPLQFGEFVVSGEVNSVICLPSSLLK